MVHRIQNRNPGYSDFSNLNLPESFNFQASTNAPISDGATALKLEEEVNLNNQTVSSEMHNSEIFNENALSNKSEIENETFENSENINQVSKEHLNEEPSNGLENFGLQEEESLELFDSTNENQDSLTQKDEQVEEEDELEIPAFLRRQKN